METNTRITGVIGRMLAFTEWLGKTRPAALKADAIAGLTVTLVLIPQSIGFPVMAALMPTHIAAKISEDHFFPTMSSAVNAIHALTHRGGDEHNCPLKTVVAAPGHEREKEI